MNGYFFTGNTTRSQFRLANVGRGQTAYQQQTWTSWDSLIVCADTADHAQKRFEEWLSAQPEGENPLETQVNKIVAAQFLDQLLTETEPVPIDWPQIAKEAHSDLESSPVDDFEQGYWLDVNAVPFPSFNIEALRRELPEDIRSGLNWAGDKQFLYLLSVLRLPPTSPPAPVDERGAEAPGGIQPLEESAGEPAPGLDEPETDGTELMDKEVAVLIRARNSAVAVWLWRKFAVNSRLARNQIRLDPCYDVLGLEPGTAP